jgi:hypothetical protein
MNMYGKTEFKLPEEFSRTDCEKVFLKLIEEGKIEKKDINTAVEEVVKEINSKSMEVLEKKLSAEEAIRLLKILEENLGKMKAIDRKLAKLKWEDVEKRLKEASPEKLWSLQQMALTGGQPCVVALEKTGEYIFMDCSLESPIGRRNCVYDEDAELELKKSNPNAQFNGNAVTMANNMGVEIMSASEYRRLAGKVKDLHSTNWIKGETKYIGGLVRMAGFGYLGDLDGKKHLYAKYDGANKFSEERGWRGVLKV